ncbi:MAG: BTAD domain-containing putative transcriptional regulator [Acidimicrobiia bacterium]|nr:BTAD domain-containing putative transcriptional regulator [Acidimicrobiia bacterium]
MDFRILGQVGVVDEGESLKLGSSRQQRLLALLLISPNRVVSTDRLLEELWAGDPPDTARHTLHVYVSRLRKALDEGSSRLVRDGTGYRLVVEDGELDSTVFERLAADGKAALARADATSAADLLRNALGLWEGPAFGGLADDGSLRQEAIRLDELRQSALEDRVWADLELGRHGEVVEELQDLTIRYPFREGFAEQLMLALYRCGRQAEALRAFQSARSNLATELGIEPGPALRLLEAQILAQDPSLELDAARQSSSGPRELPLQRTSFVGRERELAKGAKLLDGCRLLTLTGAPGSGKTRLALRLAADHADEYPHGTYYVPLAPVSNYRIWDSVVARTLGLSEVPGESALEGLKAFLRNRRLLLVLDNFEQILRAAPQVGELLDAAPELTIMVTSRARLGIAGEQEFPVPPLELPPIHDPPSLADLGRYDAVALFVARARAADPDFELSDENAAAVAAVTVRLDGLPLAIELAAARTRVLTAEELRTRLEQRLEMLTDAPTDVDDRHRTMRDAIAWSYELLDPEEQALLRDLSVFAGGFTHESAAAISGFSESEALDHIGSLLSQSLLYRPVDVGPARFAMLEMTREFALQELAAAGDVEQAAERHAHHFLELAEEVEPLLSHGQSGEGALRLSPEIDNLRTALQFYLNTDQPDLGLRLAGSIWRFWQSSDLMIEGREWLDAFLVLPAASDEARAKGLTALAGIAYWLSDHASALSTYESALAAYRTIGDGFNEADTLYAMSLTAGWIGRLDEADDYAREARRIFEDLGSNEGVGRALVAEAYVRWKRNDLAGARDLWEQSLVIARESGDFALASTQLVGLAALTFHLGQPDEAVRIVLDGLREATDQRNSHVTVWMLDMVAVFASHERPTAAVQLAGAVDVLRGEAGGGIPASALDLEDARTVAARQLGAAELEECWARGRTMHLEEAVLLAHELGESLVPG